MIEKIAKKFALSHLGAKGFIKSCVFAFGNNVVKMLPMMVFIMLLLGIDGTQALMTTSLILLMTVCAIVAVLYVVNYFDYTQLYVSSYKESARNRFRLIDKMRELPISYYAKHSTTDLTNVVLNDVADQEKLMSGPMPRMIGSLLFMLLGFVSMCRFNFEMTLILFATYPVGALIFWLTGQIEKRAHEKYSTQLAHQSSTFQEFIERMPEVRFFNFVDQAKNEFFSLLKTQEKSHLKTELSTAVFHSLITSVIQVNLLLILFVGGTWWTTNQISLVTLLIYILVATRFNTAIVSIFEALSQYRFTKIRMNRLREIFDTQSQSGTQKPDLQHYHFNVKNLHFGYDPDHEILKGITCHIPEKQVTAIVGPSGSGKSTFLRVLAKFYDYQMGEVQLDGVPVKDIDPEYLFRQISMVFQEVVLFNRSIKENIRIGNPSATDAQVLEAAKLAQCDEFALRLPAGYDTVIGENGRLLSGGQRQRVAIARAILKDSPMLFLDETSSGLDYENEFYVQKALSQLVVGKTVIVVAHRLKTVESADQILVLADGQLKETGNQATLLKNNGLFAKLWQLENHDASRE